MHATAEALQVLTIGELSRRTGVAASALRFYEERGLIRAMRTISGHRRYHRATVRRVAFIVFAQRLGFTLEEIRAELEKLPAERVPTGEDWDRLAQVWDARIAERIAELERLRGSLTECIGCGCLSLKRCTILNPSDRMARNGPGPRFWLGDPRPGREDADPAECGGPGQRPSRSRRGARVARPSCGGGADAPAAAAGRR